MTIRKVTSLRILPGTLLGFAVNSAKSPRLFRERIIRGAWMLVKQQAARYVRNIEISQIRGIDQVWVHGPAMGYDRLIVSALCQLHQSKTFFEFGTYLGQTTWLVAHNNPETKLFTLDLPSSNDRSNVKLELTDPHLFVQWERGVAFADTPEAERIVRLVGDSADFDFSPYFGNMDAVFIDASHSYSYVKADTEAALKMLSPTGVLIWHDYPAYPGVFAYLNELARTCNRPIWHILGTGLAWYSRQDI